MISASIQKIDADLGTVALACRILTRTPKSLVSSLLHDSSCLVVIASITASN